MTVSDQEAVDLLTEMLRIPSLTGQEDALAGMLRSWMADHGFRAQSDEAGNAVGEIGPGGAARTLVFLGHMDTVPGEIRVEMRDGRLYGRGAVDAKGPLAAALVAAARARSRLRVRVIGAVQEEGPSAGARYLAAQPAPDYLVIGEPSGWDALVLGYKGSQRCEVVISRGVTHSALPEPTAAEEGFAFWQRLTAWCEERSNGAFGLFNRLTPTLLSMDTSSDGLLEQATLRIGLRLPPGAVLPEVRAGVRDLLPGGEISFSPGEEAVRGAKSNALVTCFRRAVQSEGGEPRFKVKTGTSDMNVVGPVWGCPMLAYGPGDSHLDHTPEEHIVIDEYLRGIRVLTRVLEDLL